MTRSIFYSGLKLIAKIAGVALIAGLFSAPVSAAPLTAGEYVIRQKSSMRYLDAYTGGTINNVVMRNSEGNDTQVWIITPVGKNKYRIQQKANGLYLDANQGSSVITRGYRDNRSQVWRLDFIANANGRFNFNHRPSGKFMDAEAGASDNAVTLRNFVGDEAQQWIVTRAGTGPTVPTGPIIELPDFELDLGTIDLPVQLSGTYLVQQKSNMRFMDAHEGTRDNSAVTRDFQNNNTQQWVFRKVTGNIYTIQQRSNMMYLDAYEGTGDNDVVTRGRQNNATQQWIIKRVSGNIYTVQQRSNSRYLDAHEYSGKDFRIVTRDRQNNATQQWIIRLAN